MQSSHVLMLSDFAKKSMSTMVCFKVTTLRQLLPVLLRITNIILILYTILTSEVIMGWQAQGETY